MKALLAILTILAVPLVLMNVLGGVVSGIWLAFLRQWGALGIGVLSLIFATFTISFALLPSIILNWPAAKLFERGHIALGSILAIPASIYTTLVMVVWCYGVFTTFLSMSSPTSLVPMLLWSYGVATGPWSYMAQRESQGNDGYDASATHVLFVSLGYLLMVAMYLFAGANPSTCLTALVMVMTLALLTQLIVTISVLIGTRGRSTYET